VIVTVTLNLALDVTYEVASLQMGATNRVQGVHERAGGKGVNVARVLHALGVPVVATGIAGGTVGARIESDLVAAGIQNELVHVQGESRRCLAVIDRSSGVVTEINEAGPVVGPESWGPFAKMLDSVLGDAAVVVLSGSLPPGLGEDAYAELARLATNRGVATILDAGGAPLRAGLAAGPRLVKPNLAELTEATGRSFPPGSGPAEWMAGLADLVAAGAGAAVGSFGPEGLLALTPIGTWQAKTVSVEGNPVGAGDAAVASLARGELEGWSWPERLRDAVALSAAAVASPSAGEFDPTTYDRARRDASVIPLG
jgi:tagatose 6-phosphate kinase